MSTKTTNQQPKPAANLVNKSNTELTEKELTHVSGGSSSSTRDSSSSTLRLYCCTGVHL